jgi:hypothetical protein
VGRVELVRRKWCCERQQNEREKGERKKPGDRVATQQDESKLTP